jgi:hypothetical protein
MPEDFAKLAMGENGIMTTDAFPDRKYDGQVEEMSPVEQFKMEGHRRSCISCGTFSWASLLCSALPSLSPSGGGRSSDQKLGPCTLATKPGARVELESLI